MATLSQIADAIKTTLNDNITGLRVYDTVPDLGLNFPVAFIVPTNIDFDTSMQRGTDLYTFDILVACQRTDSRSGQDKLATFITGQGSTSIRQAIFNNSTLGLADTSSRCVSVTNISADVSVNGIDAIGANVEIQVYTKGTS
jgi:hypothetical protein|tara:strand:+ start:1468 stop:1893 length:426 start_codon:yes stop_codon:yes gene_type:complete